MALKNIFNILVDLKIVRSINQPLVTQNDSVVFILEVMDNGVPFDLTDTTTISLAHTRKDGTVVVTPGTKIGNIATFELGTNETAVAGGVIAKAQFYGADGRVSTLSFGYTVGVDPTGSGYVPSETEQTLIQVVMADAQAKIDELSAVDVVVLNQQLAEKAEIVDVRLKAVKLELEDTSDTFISAITGGATVNVLSIPQNDSVTIGKLDSQLRNDLTIPMTNRIVNGNFTDTTGWSQTSAYGRASTLSAANNTLSIAGTTTAGAGARSVDGIFELNKKYYVKIKARVTNPNATIMSVKQGDVSTIKQVLSPIQNQWYEMDGILNVTSVVHTFLHFFHQYADSTTANGKVMEVQYVTAFDLTSQYGVGLEPNVDNFRETLSFFDNSWFNGTKSLFKADNVLNRVKTLETNDTITSQDSVVTDIFADKTPNYNISISPTTGVASSNVSFVATNFLVIEPSTTYKVNRNDNMYSSTGNVAFYDANKVFISGVQSSYEDWTTPSNAKYVRFAIFYGSYTQATFTFDNVSVIKGNVHLPPSDIPVVTDLHVYGSLYGKKWVGIGDSITQKTQRSEFNYHDYVKQELGLSFVNMGEGGTGYKHRDHETPGVAIYQRALNCPTDADIITIFGGVNDVLFATVEIGTATDSGTNTLCGCVNTTIDNLESLMPYVPLGIITPLPCDWVETTQSSYPTQRPDVLNSRMSLFVEQLIQICKLRGIPCLDLFHQSNLRPWDSAVNVKYFSCGDSPLGDGLHPNSKGHKLIYRKTMKFVETLASS